MPRARSAARLSAQEIAQPITFPVVAAEAGAARCAQGITGLDRVPGWSLPSSRSRDPDPGWPRVTWTAAGTGRRGGNRCCGLGCSGPSSSHHTPRRLTDGQGDITAVRSAHASLIRFCLSVMATLWLLVLTPLSCMVTSQQEFPPFRKLRLEPEEHRLSWERNGDDQKKVECRKNQETPVKVPTGMNYCTFQSLSLCHTTNYTVYYVHNKSVAALIRFPETDPNRPAAATNLSCRVHDLKLMTCRWVRGLGAPQDVQYRMFWRDTRLGRDQDCECPQYEEAMGGVRVGCRLDDVTTLPTQVTVTVNGSSSLAPVSCSDTSVDLPEEEILTPPTLTAVCNGSEAHVSWDMRSYYHTKFQYELQINKSSHLEPKTEETRHSHFRLLNPGSVSFRVRAKPDSNSRFSAWSKTVSLVCDPHVTPTVGIIVATAVGLTALLILLLLCRRFLMKLFPPIPRMKDPMGNKAEHGEMVTWGAATEDCEVTHVMET